MGCGASKGDRSAADGAGSPPRPTTQEVTPAAPENLSPTDCARAAANVVTAKRALVVALDLADRTAACDDGRDEVLEASVQFAMALTNSPGKLAKGMYEGPDSLFAMLHPKTADGLAPVRLLRTSWIKVRAGLLREATIDEERRRLALPRRQDLERDEPEAFISPEELEALPRNKATGSLPLGASSYCWLTPEHPDPLGEQLVSLAAAIERAETEGEHGNPSGQAFPAEAAMFIDFGSLHQKDHEGKRSESEKAAFDDALSCMQLWYAHPLTTAFLTRSLPSGYDGVLGYAERGWPTCESSWAALAKVTRDVSWAPIFDVMSSRPYTRPSPMAPATLARLVASKRFTSKKGDLPMVIELNTRTILSLFQETTELGYAGLGWGDAEVVQLCGVIPFCRSLTKLFLYRNNIGDLGVSELAAVCARGALTQLVGLDLAGNEIGEEGMKSFAEALSRGA